MSLVAAIVLTGVAGLAGLPVGAFFEFPSYGSSLASIGWKVATLLVMVAGMRVLEKRRPTAQNVGLVPVAPKPVNERAKPAIIGIIAMLALAQFWGEIPVLKEFAPATDGSSYNAGAVTTGLLVFELLVRYPIGVIAEEIFFRGFLQSRLTLAPPVLSGVLFAGYHLQQWETIPSLIPFGIALGLLRWWLGSIWPGAALHYGANAMFILSLR